MALRDKLLGGPVGEQRLDFRTVLVQFAFAGAFRPSDRQAGSPSRAKGLPSSARRSTPARSQRPNGLEYAEKSGQEIAEGCNRLIRNSIICRNYLYLTQKITLAKSEEERKRLLDIIETHSPQSWASFNMPGEFDFSDEKLQDTTGVLSQKKQTEIIPENREVPNR